MQDFDAAARGLDNTTCAADISKLLYEIFAMRTTEATHHMAFQILSAQRLNTKLPRLLPTGINCAHKTGNLPHLEHDAGILSIGDRAVIAVMLTDELIDNKEGIGFCQTVGQRVAEYLLPRELSQRRALDLASP